MLILRQPYHPPLLNVKDDFLPFVKSLQKGETIKSVTIWQWNFPDRTITYNDVVGDRYKVNFEEGDDLISIVGAKCFYLSQVVSFETYN